MEVRKGRQCQSWTADLGVVLRELFVASVIAPAEKAPRMSRELRRRGAEKDLPALRALRFLPSPIGQALPQSHFLLKDDGEQRMTPLGHILLPEKHMYTQRVCFILIISQIYHFAESYLKRSVYSYNT